MTHVLRPRRERATQNAYLIILMKFLAADVVAVFANILVYWGRWREALTWMDTAKRLNPLPPNLYHWYHALALYSAREYEQAIKVLKQMRSSDRWSHCLLAACYPDRPIGKSTLGIGSVCQGT